MAIRFDQIELSDSGNHLYPFIEADNGYFRIRTTSGEVKIGPGNSTYSHFYTDRGNFYFNKGTAFDGNVSAYGGDENLTNWNNVDASAFRSKANTAYLVDPDSTSVLDTVQANYFRASTSSTTDPILRLTDAGVASYDVVFPDTNTYRLETSTSSTKTFKLHNAGSGSFKMQADEFVKTGGTSSQYLMADGSVSTSVNDSTKLPLAGGTMTGDIVMQDEMVNFAAGNPELPNFRGKRSNTQLNNRDWDTEGGWSYTTFENQTTDRPRDGLHNGNGLLTFNTHAGDGTNNYMHQIALCTSPGTLHHRNRSGSSWNSWYEIAQTNRSLTGNLQATAYYDASSTTYYLDPANTGTSLNVAGKITAGSFSAAEISHAATNLLTLTNTSNGGGAGIVFNDNNGGAQRVYLRGYHADGSSQGGGASLHLQSTETDLVFVVGDSSNTGRIAVKSANSNSEVDYGFYSDVNTGIYSPAAGQVGLVSDGSRKLLVNNNGVLIQNGNLFIPDHSLYVGNYIYHDGDTNTYIYFTSDNIKLRTGGDDRLELSDSGAFFKNEVMDSDGQSIKGYRLNKATSSSWTAGGTSNQTGWYGGNFNGSEITTKWVVGPHGERTLAAETSGDTGNDYDGGYVKQISNLDINKSHLSVVYIKRISSAGTGNVYHGTGAGTNQITNLSNSSNTNPYFHHPGLTSFPQDVWCVSIGVIQANNDDNTDASIYTGSSALSGIYRCDTGEKILNSSNAWKMGSAGSTLNNGIRFFHYYSTDASAKLQWAKPGFYEINGNEPTLAELLAGGSTSVLNNLVIDDYIYHKDDTDTYFGFDSANSIRFVAGNSERLKITGDVNVSGSTDLTIPQGRKFRLDGAGGHTYITEESDSNLKFYVAGSEHLLLGGGDIYLQKPARMDSYLYHIGNTGTSMQYDTDNIKFRTGNLVRAEINNSGAIIASGRITIGQTTDAGSTYRLYTAAGGQVYFGGHLTGTSATFSGTIDNGSNYANLGNVNFVGIGNSPKDTGTGGGTGSGSGKLLGFNSLNGSSRASATLGVNDQGIVMEYEKVFTFKVEGSGWVNRATNPYKIIQAPGADKMIVVDEFLVYIDYETRTGIGYGQHVARPSDAAAYSVGFYQNETGQAIGTAAHGVSGTFYTLGIMPGGFMNNTADRGYYRDVPVHQSALIANRSLFWKTNRNCNSSNVPGGAHYIKVKYRIVDISDEFSDNGVNHKIDTSSYHGQYAHTANLQKDYNDAGQAVQ